MTSSLIDRLNAVSEQVAIKRPVRVATTANITLSGFQTIDGVLPTSTDENLRILVKNQNTQTENGIYTMTTGTWERTDDFDGNRDVIKGTRVPVTEGTVAANKTYVVTTSDPITIESSNIAFSEITESLVTTEYAKPRAPETTVSIDTTLTASDAGKLFNVDCSGADRVITMPAGSALTDGDQIGIRYSSGTNQVTIVCQGADAINGKTSFALSSRYECVWIEWDGSAFCIISHTDPFPAGKIPFLKVVNRSLLTPPVGPEPGARYIIASAGTPTGDWSSYANNDIIESNGQSGWIRYTPAESWLVYVDAEDKYCYYTGAAWQGLPNTDDPASSNLGYALFQDQRSSAQVGGTATTGAWTARTLQTTVANTITGMSLATNTITFPAGKYLILAHGTFWKTGWSQLRFQSTTTATSIVGTSINAQASGQGFTVPVIGILNLSAQEAFKLEYYVEATVGTSDLGAPLAGNPDTEVYATVQVIDLSSLQGAVGAQGVQGPQGFAGYKYQYSSTTTQSDPGAGFIRMNNANLALVTAMVIDATSAETGNPDISDEIAAWNSTGGILRICEVASEQNFVSYTVNSVTDNGGYLSLVVTYRTHSTGFSNNDNVSLQFTAKGETGASGGSFPVFDYLFNTATAGDPGSGQILFNNATLSSATAFNISETDRVATNRATDIASWDDDGSTSNRGYLYLVNITTGARVGVFKVTGTITDNGTYDTYSVTAVSGTAPANGTRVALMFVPAGATGNINGSLGATDGLITKTSGTGGTTIQAGLTAESSAGKVTVNAASTSGVATFSALKLSNLPTVVGATGGGVAIDFETKNASSAAFTSAQIIAETRTAVSSSEDSDLVIKAMANGTLTERARLRGETGNLEFGSSNAFALKATGGQTLTGGFATSSTGLGTISGTTLTPDPSKGQLQFFTNGGAFQINPPASDTSIDFLVTNSSNNGTITYSSNFTVGSNVGDTLPTANNSKGIISVQRINGVSTYSLRSLSTST